MDLEDVERFDFKDICITEFDEIYGKFDSFNTPLSRLPSVSTQGISGNEFELFWRANSQSSVQECVLPSDQWAIQIPYPSSHALITYLDHLEGDKHSLLTRPKNELTWHILKDVPVMAIVVNDKTFENLLCQSDFDWFCQRGCQVKRRELNSSTIFSFSSALFMVLDRYQHAVNQASCVDFDNELSEFLLQFFELLMATQEPDLKISNRERILTRALDFIRHNYHCDTKIRDIVDYAHTTSRNLQIVFKTQFGITPLQYIKRYRLMKFHRGMRRYGSVTEAAICSGLRHMGRLPDQYRGLFGENPGDYLNRLKHVSRADPALVT
jgi:AraC-like DNA-binding protein